MSMLYVLIALALGLLALAIWALFWAIGNRQFDDLESQGWSVVLDNDQEPPQDAPGSKTSTGANSLQAHDASKVLRVTEQTRKVRKMTIPSDRAK
jgi:cbb3-type cytochrome oxidase maturation protein